MAGVKISALPSVPSALLTDIFPMVQGGVTYRQTLSQTLTLFSSSLVGTFVPIAGGTMTGSLILNGDATLPLGAVTLQQLQTVASGFTVILACLAGTTANLNAIYANGAAGVGATLIDNSGTFAPFSTDGISPALGDRILVKNQTTTFENGIYELTVNGDGIGTDWVLTRTTDYDQAPAEIYPGTLVAINSGTTLATTSWLETATVTTIGVDPILFSQFTFSPGAFLLRANNLSDLNSIPTALVNLGLGVPTGTGNVVLQTSPTLITPILGAASATSLTFTSTSGIIGSTTNDSAAVGSVGQYVSSIVLDASSVALTTGVNRDITSIILSAGDWDVWGNFAIRATGGIVTFSGWISQTSATLSDFALRSTYNPQVANSGPDCGWPVPGFRFSLAVPTTIYLTALAIFGSGTCFACGGIYARRVR